MDRTYLIELNQEQIFSIYRIKQESSLKDANMNIPNTFTLFHLLRVLEQYIVRFDLLDISCNILSDTLFYKVFGYKILPLFRFRNMVLEHLDLVKVTSIPPSDCPVEIIQKIQSFRTDKDKYSNFSVKEEEKNEVKYKLNLCAHHLFCSFIPTKVNAFSIIETLTLLKQYLFQNNCEIIRCEAENIWLIKNTKLSQFTSVKALRESQMYGFIAHHLIDRLSSEEKELLQKIEQSKEEDQELGRLNDHFYSLQI